MLVLRQSTAVDVLIGPFVDGTDGATPEEALSPSVQLSKNGQTAATKSDVTTPVHDNAGYYNCEFDATDTGTVGQLVAFIEGSTATHLAVRHEFQIMDTAAFDALFADGAEGPLQATTVGNTLDVSAAGEAGIDWANIGSPTTAQNLSGTNIDVDQVVASVSGNVDGSVGSISGITFPTNFADLSIVITTGLVDITQAAADKVWSTAARILTAATNITSTGGTTFTQTGDSFARLGAPAGASVSADILEVEGQTRKIKKNEAFSDLTFLMVDSTTKDPKTGLTITEEVSKDGAAFGDATGTAAEIANGIYQMDASAADMNADVLIFRFSSAGADDTFVTIVTKP